MKAKEFELRKLPKRWRHPKRLINGFIQYVPLKHLSFFSSDLAEYDSRFKRALISGWKLEDWENFAGKRPTKLSYSPVFTNATEWVLYKNNIPCSLSDIKAFKRRQLLGLKNV